MITKDQHGNQVPFNRLIVIDQELVRLLDFQQISQVLEAKWYTVRGFILLNFDEINFLGDIEPFEAGIEQPYKIQCVERPLHHFTISDGFYSHA